MIMEVFNVFDDGREEIFVSLTESEMDILTNLAKKLNYESDNYSELINKAIRVYSDMVDFVRL